MKPDEKAAWRWAYACDPKVVHETLIHEHHAEVAEYRLRTERLKPELMAYVLGIGRAVR